MLVKLTSNTSGEIIMFAEHARRLFDIIGKECTAEGVFTKEQLPEAITKLQHAVKEEKATLHEAERKAREGGVEAEENVDDEDHKSGRVGINLGQRAHPLINLMEWTLKEGGFVLWKAERDF